MRPSLLVAGTLLGGALLAGCGDAADDFRSEAEAICREGNAAIDRVAKDFGTDGPTAEQLEEAAPKVPPLLDRELDRLDALEPPEELADDVAEMLASYRAEVERMRREGPAFFEDGDPFAAAYAKAEELGLDECAR